MKILKCKRGQIYHIGFFDPYIVNSYTVDKHYKDIEANLLRFLKKQNTMEEIQFPCNFKWVLMSLYTFYVAYLMLSVIDELYMYAYKNMRNYH
jgi:hypothetical protein